jgi:hypothetical protein
MENEITHLLAADGFFIFFIDLEAYSFYFNSCLIRTVLKQTMILQEVKEKRKRLFPRRERAFRYHTKGMGEMFTLKQRGVCLYVIYFTT